jgi:hypothetical protein
LFAGIVYRLHIAIKPCATLKETTAMTKTITVLTAAVIVAVSAMAAPTKVRAGDGGAVIGGVLGGLAAGAIIGGAVAPRPYYDPYYAPAYGPPPVYAVPEPEVCVERRQVWSNRYQAYVVRNVSVPCY